MASVSVALAAIPAMEIGDEAPTALYRLFNASGELLYVGITGDLKARLAQHAASKAWWPDVTRKTVEWHLTRSAAAVAEIAAIRGERPIHNIQGRRTDVSCDEVIELALSGMQPASLKLALLELAGITTPTALDLLGVRREHRSRVIKGRTRICPQS